MTEKLYYKDSRISEFDARVLLCERFEQHYAIVLDRTAFFPCEGGQYADAGTLSGIDVLDVTEKDGVIYHLTDTPIETNASVHGIIDYSSRYEKMQCHSGEHIVSGLIHKIYGLNNVGFHLGRDDVTLDFDGILNTEQLSYIERLANEAVYDNIEILCDFPAPELLATLDYRSKLELSENVRIVTIPGIDACACCAPHVSRTGEIGIIKLLDFIHYKGGIRVHMLCGRRALRDYDARYRRNREVSNLISVKQTDTGAGVARLLEENGRLKSEINEIKKSIVNERISSLTQTDKSIIVFEEILGIDAMRPFANAAANLTSRFSALFCKKGDNGYSFIIAVSEHSRQTAREILSLLKERADLRAGGSDTMVSGVIDANEKDIRDILETI